MDYGWVVEKFFFSKNIIINKIKMNPKTPFYGMSFSHGELRTKQKIKKNVRYTNPNALRESDKGYIPIHSFGTLGTATYYSSTIVCFNIFANIYGTEFMAIVSDSLLKYGNNYMKRYKVSGNSSDIEKAVGYLFKVNANEIETYPQNRFYTFYKENQQPYDYTLYSNKVNETVISNIPFPTIELKKEGKKYFTITDFFNSNNFNVSEFENNLSIEWKKPDGNEMFPDKSFIGNEEVDMRAMENPFRYMEFRDYEYEFGICKIKNIFSILSMGLYGSIMKEKEDDHLLLLENFIDGVSFSEVINFFANYNENGTFECRGIFTFHCKAPDFNIIPEEEILNLQQQQYQRQGLLPLTQEELLQQQLQQQHKKQKRKAKQLVKKVLKKK